MEFDTNGLTREEVRKRRRKKERTQAMLLLAGVILGVCLIIGGIVFALVSVLSDKKDTDDMQAVDAVATESVTEQLPAPDEDVAVEENTSIEDILEEENAQTDETVEDTTQEDTEEMQSEDTAEDTDAEEEADEELPSLFEDKENDEQLESLISEKISAMTLEQKVAGLFFVTPAQLMGIESDVTAVGSEFGNKILQYPVGGLVFDESNMASEEEFETFVSNVAVYAPEDMFVGIENEGGENAPFVAKEFTENVISSYKEIGESLGVSGAYSAGISIGSELRQYGIDVNFAPNVDVSLKEGSVAQQDGFGVDMDTVTELGENMIKGLSDQGIHTTVKHFPSYGDSTHDGDSGQVISQRTKEDLAKEYAPYLEAIEAGADFVMISHVSLPKVRGDNRPASLSKEVITDIVRTEWEYDGIVITDFMNRSCMYQKYTYAEAAVGAIEAGADMILSPKNFLKSYNGILDAVNKGTLTEERIDESLRRIYRVKLAE